MGCRLAIFVVLGCFVFYLRLRSNADWAMLDLLSEVRLGMSAESAVTYRHSWAKTAVVDK